MPERFRIAYKLVYMLLYSPESSLSRFADIDSLGRITLRAREICKVANMTNHRFNEQIHYLEECNVITNVDKPKLGQVRFILNPPPIFKLLNAKHVENTDRISRIISIINEPEGLTDEQS